MNKLYVFGIGGTGSRVLKALTLLMSTGVDIPVDSIVPIIIDPDAAGGNKTDTVNIMDLYTMFHSRVSYGDGKTKFFKTPLTKLHFPSNDYVMPLGGQTNKKFKDYMHFGGFSQENQAFINMLFSDENLESDMTVGFTGNPNIGSVILNQFTESQEFINFANTFQPGDGIFIVSSIFGGTGASGFPLLLKNLRHLNPNLHIPSAQAIMTAKIGALTMLPYFQVEANPDSKIDSDTFISKTKAALSYYEHNLQNLDALYYLGDPARKQYKNNEGGVQQRNDAHFMELVGALSIVDFAKNADSIMSGQNIYKEFGIKNDTREISFMDLEQFDYVNIARPMTEFTLFCRYMSTTFANSLDQVWVNTDTPLYNKEFFGSMSHTNLGNYVNHYMTWLREMQGNDRAFVPFNLTENSGDVFGFVKEIPTKKVASFKSNWDLVNDRLNSVKKASICKQQGTIEGRFIAHVNEAFAKVVAEKIKL